MGGPCVSNPLPYAAFIDAFWIGEAEAGFFELAARLAALKHQGRERLLAVMAGHPHIWTGEKREARRAVDTGFALRPPAAAVFPVPSMKVVQHHGAVEIMRGCPNGCRFCHAGFWYRPMRQKSAEVIRREAEDFILKGGYREISLSSLSSGDYRYLDPLVDCLNRRFSGFHVSFQLPSLRVSTFSLPLVEKISLVRKSGLTFAVETPEESWQLAINKEVSLDSVVSILGRARKNGWRGAKFYFMIGLPASGPGEGGSRGEAEAIVSFVQEAARRTGFHFNVNVGVFVPKPHTPYQRAPQIGLEEAEAALEYIRGSLKPFGHRTGVSDPLVSRIEGILSRGDAAVSDIIEDAWRAGCRLDAWQDGIKKDLWRKILAEYPDQVCRIQRGWGAEENLPWGIITSGVGEGYVSREYARSESCVLTSPCTEKCTHPCGICGPAAQVIHNGTVPDEAPPIVQNIIPDKVNSPSPGRGEPGAGGRGGTHRILFSFEKKGPAVFQAHLSVLEIFAMTFVRAEIPVCYSEGFNPLPRLEVVAPLSLGIGSEGEIAALDTESALDAAAFADRVNPRLPRGFAVRAAEYFYIPRGAKKYALSPLLWGFAYLTPGGSRVNVPKEGEKEFRASLESPPPGGPPGTGSALYRLKRLAVLARDPPGAKGGAEDRGESYFDVYRRLYPGTGP
jgi:radical SAM superfamily enzyme YgiQ (UPF0313 family)